MGNTRNTIAGINILMKYVDDDTGYHLGAEHDVIYFFATPKPVVREDIDQLISLGWFQEDAEYDVEKGFGADDYDVNESWTMYV